MIRTRNYTFCKFLKPINQVAESPMDCQEMDDLFSLVYILRNDVDEERGLRHKFTKITAFVRSFFCNHQFVKSINVASGIHTGNLDELLAQLRSFFQESDTKERKSVSYNLIKRLQYNTD